MSLQDAQSAGLRTEQAPPMAVVASFFALVPLAMMACGGLLLWRGSDAMLSHWMPAAMAATHLGTLGLLGSAMLGALYQMTPVVAGAPVPGVRLAHGVHALWTVGVTALVVALSDPATLWFSIAFGALLAALVGFAVPLGIALWRAPSRSESTSGMRLALLGLCAVAGIGLRLAWGWATGTMPEDRPTWLAGHAALGLLTWVGALLTAVSFQVVPMFYLTPACAPRPARMVLGAIALSWLGMLVSVLGGLGTDAVALCAVPAALAVWVVHPVWMLRLMAARRRKRSDPSLDFWRAGLSMAPLVAVAGALTWASGDGRWPLLFAWLAIFGWAGMIVHGMLTRIVPFLAWFHRFAALAGHVPVPPMRRLLPPNRARPGLWLHGLAVVSGATGILSGWWPAMAAAGLLLAAAGATLAYALVRVALTPVPQLPAPDAPVPSA